MDRLWQVHFLQGDPKIITKIWIISKVLSIGLRNITYISDMFSSRKLKKLYFNKFLIYKSSKMCPKWAPSQCLVFRGGTFCKHIPWALSTLSYILWNALNGLPFGNMTSLDRSGLRTIMCDNQHWSICPDAS